MNFLITGAAGFLGAALANQLAREGHQVRGLDDLSTGEPQALFEDVHFTRGDVSDRPKLWTVSLMEAMRDVGVGRVVFISSGAVYGDQQAQPVNEQMHPQPHSPYAVSKLAAEYYVNTIGALWGIDTVILRVFNAFGPGQHLPPAHAPLIPNFLRQAVRGGTLVVHGDGRQSRDFIFVSDVVRAMIAAATAPNLNQEVINVGTGQETSVRDVAAKVLEITGNKGEILYTPRNDGGVSRLCADISLAKKKLSFTPRYDLAEGIRLTLERDERFQVK